MRTLNILLRILGVLTPCALMAITFFLETEADSTGNVRIEEITGSNFVENYLFVSPKDSETWGCFIFIAIFPCFF